MKRMLTLFLVMSLLLVTVSGLAASAYTEIDGKADRGITVQPAADHDPIPGVSPTTGRLLADYQDLPDTYLGLAVTGQYLPMLVQIDNAGGGVDNLAQWGLQYADIIYETPLVSAGGTRLSALFSDVLPDAAGPIRSARVGHARLAAEWFGGFVHYGGQTKKGSDVQAEMIALGIKRYVNRFDGTDGSTKPWKAFFTPKAGTTAPHHQSANVAALSQLVDAELTPVNHTFLFADELPTAGEPAEEIAINQGAADYNSRLVYHADEQVYYRYMVGKNSESLYTERDTGEVLTFANVIVQFTTVNYNGSGDAPVMVTLGEGNADIFMGGRRIAGYWKHDDYEHRTVFYDDQGNEIALQRGRTLISIVNTSKKIGYR